MEAARETDSGLHGRRKALLRILRNPNVQVIVVEHRDRLMRFELEYEAALAAQGRRLVVVDGAEIADYIVGDERLQRLSRWHSRKKKGSHNRRKCAMRLARLHARISNIRQNWLHQTRGYLDLFCLMNQAMLVATDSTS